MRFLKFILILFFLLQINHVFSQNKKNVLILPPSVLNTPPTTNFSWLNACLGDTTCFINQTIRGVTYTWTISNDTTFGPFGIISSHVIYKSTNDSSICYHFPTPGIYTVSLLAYNNHYVSETKIITIDTITKADFSFITCSNNFVNNSLCATSFYWDFGDGKNATAAMPIHQYADTGHYNVTLIAYNGNYSDTITKQIFVDVEAWASAAFTKSINKDTLFVHATFTGKVANYNWAFGGGGYATGKDTLFVYKDSSAYYGVELVVVNACGPAFGIDTIHIIKDSIISDAPPPDLDFSSSILTVVPNPVTSNDYIDAFFNSYNDNIYLAQVYNALGEKMFEENFTFQTGINEFKISAANLTSGVYVLVLQAGNSYVRKKFYIVTTNH